MAANWDIKYEEKIRPAIEDFNQDPFTSAQLAAETEHTPQSIGHVLGKAAEKPGYDVEIVGRHPYVFSTEGNEMSEDEENLQKEKEQSQESPILDKAYGFLEENGDSSESEIRSLLNDEIDADSMEAQARRNGELFQSLKEYRDVEYVKSEKKFRIEG